jgi:hypothetical protein
MIPRTKELFFDSWKCFGKEIEAYNEFPLLKKLDISENGEESSKIADSILIRSQLEFIRPCTSDLKIGRNKFLRTGN